MSLPVKFYAFIALACLTACGFQPVYGDKPVTAAGSHPNVAGAMSEIYIETIPDRSGQYLRNALIDRFYLHGRPETPRYALHIAPIQEQEIDLDITKSSSATRGQLRLSTNIRLVDHRGGQTVLTRDVLTVTSYNILQSQFTTRVSQEAARQSALDDLAGQIERHIALHLNAAR